MLQKQHFEDLMNARLQGTEASKKKNNSTKTIFLHHDQFFQLIFPDMGCTHLLTRKSLSCS